jgi:WD40 repeat protein
MSVRPGPRALVGALVGALACTPQRPASPPSTAPEAQADPRVAAPDPLDPLDPTDLGDIVLDPVVQLAHAAEVGALAFSSDGSSLASASSDGRVVLWDLATRAAWLDAASDTNIQALAWVRSDRALFVSSPGGADALFLPKAGELRRDRYPAFALVLGGGPPSTPHFMRSSDDLLRWLDAEFKPVQSRAAPSGLKIDVSTRFSLFPDGRVALQEKYNGPLWVLAMDPGGPDLKIADTVSEFIILENTRLLVRVAVPNTWRSTTEIRDSRSGDIIHTFPEDARFEWPVAAARGKLWATVHSGVQSRPEAFAPLDMTTGAPLQIHFRGSNDNVALAAEGEKFSVAATSPTGDRIAVATTTGRILLFDAASQASLGVLGHRRKAAQDLTFLDGRRLLVRHRDSVSTWDLATGRRTGQRPVPGLIGVGARPGGGFNALRRTPAQCPYYPDGVARESWTFPDVAAGSATRTSRGAPTSPSRPDVTATLPILGKGQGTCITTATAESLGDEYSGHPELAAAGKLILRRARRHDDFPIYTPDPSAPWFVYSLADSRTTVLADSAPLFLTSENMKMFHADSAGAQLSADGTLLLVGHTPMQGPRFPPVSASLWSLPDGRKRWSLEITAARAVDGVFAYGLSPDGQRLAIGRPGRVEVHDTSDLDAVRRIWRMPFSGGLISAVLPSRDDEVWVGTSTGTLTRMNSRGPIVSATHGAHIVHIREDPALATLATVDSTGGVTLWGHNDGRPRLDLIDFDDGAWMAVAATGRYTSSAGAEGRIAWRVRSGGMITRSELPRLLDEVDVAAAAVGAPHRAARINAPLPRLSVRRVAEQSTPSSSHIAIAVTLSPGHTARVFVFRNGVPLHERALKQSGSLALDVPMPRGMNRVTVQAFDEFGVGTRPIPLDAPSGTAEVGEPKLWLVGIGTGRYPALPESSQLRVADDDVLLLGQALQRHAGPGRPYKQLNRRVLLNEDVSAPSIRDALKGLEAMQPQDLGFVLLAGHGVLLDGELFYLTGKVGETAASIRSGGVRWAQIVDGLKHARGRVVVLLDLCHAGGIHGTSTAANDALAAELLAARRAGVVVFAASRKEERSEEGPSNGVFTGALVASMASAETDTNNDGWLALSEIVDATTRRVVQQTDGRQNPQVAHRAMFGDPPVVPLPGIATP